MPTKANEPIFFALLKRATIARPLTEHRFHPARRFRLDYAWTEAKLGLEVDGGVWSGGAHGRGTGIVRDQEKTNLAAGLGWRIIRVTPQHLCTEQTITYLQDALQWRVEPAS
jgi:very-short-patch-repair endonuclease